MGLGNGIKTVFVKGIDWSQELVCVVGLNDHLSTGFDRFDKFYGSPIIT